MFSVLSDLVWRGQKTALPGGGILACEIYHKLLSGATTEHLEESGRGGGIRDFVNCK
jgi:hypothetical protein